MYKNVFWPHIGAAGTPYARSVQPRTVQPAGLPDPETLFDSLLARKEFKEHPCGISSVLFYLASIIIHGMYPVKLDFVSGEVSITNGKQTSSRLTPEIRPYL